MRLVLLMVGTVSLLAAGIACTSSQMAGNNTAANRASNNAVPAANAASPPPVAVQMTPVPDGVERISVEDAKKEFDKGTAVFVDTRNAESYNAQHIQGALNITVDKVDENLSKLPKGKKIIIYCS